jgi:hypothetical protein
MLVRLCCWAVKAVARVNGAALQGGWFGLRVESVTWSVHRPVSEPTARSHLTHVTTVFDIKVSRPPRTDNE